MHVGVLAQKSVNHRLVMEKDQSPGKTYSTTQQFFPHRLTASQRPRHILSGLLVMTAGGELSRIAD